ncbi:MAG TPA: chlorophyllase, partial [Actinoplanes sp.]|nr:chlorophyllase [Actinoplanes sp.]
MTAPVALARLARRTVAGCCAAVLVAGPAACSSDGDGPSSVAPVVSASPPMSAAPTATAEPRPNGSVASPIRVTPPPGRAPASAFAVGTRQLSISRGPSRPLPTSLWYPAVGPADRSPAAGRQPAAGPFPVVLFSHGLTAAPVDYADLLAAWAAAGFVVAAPAYPFTSTGVPRFNAGDVVNQPADASTVLSSVLALQGKAGDPLQGRLNVARTAAAGHSAGGVTTLGLFSSDRDDRLDAGVVLAGRRLLPTAFTGAPAAILFVHGKKDRTVRYAEARAAFDAVP